MPPTSHGGRNAEGRQLGRAQICTYCFPRGLPPQGFAAGPQKALSGGFPPVDEEISTQGRLRPVLGHLRSPTAIPGRDAQGESGASGR